MSEYGGESQYQCTVCETMFYYGSPHNNGVVAGRTCNEPIVICGKTGITESYKIGCGKTEDTIEKAVIIYN